MIWGKLRSESNFFFSSPRREKHAGEGGTFTGPIPHIMIILYTAERRQNKKKDEHVASREKKIKKKINNF
jgi:hypothetical protein